MASVFELAEEAVKSEAGRVASEVAGGARPSEVTDAWSAIRSADVGGVVRMLHTALGSSTGPAEDPRVPPGDQAASPARKGGGAAHSASQPEALRDQQRQPPGVEGSNHAQQPSFRQRLEELAREHEDMQAWCETLSTDNRKLRGHLASADDEREARQKELSEKQKVLEQEQRTVASLKESNRQVTNMLNMEKQNAMKEHERVKGLVSDKQREIKELQERIHVLAGGGVYNPGDLPGPPPPGLPPPGMSPNGLPMPGPPPPGLPPPGLLPRHPMPMLPCSQSGGCPGSDFIREYMQQDTAPSFDTPGSHAAQHVDERDDDHSGADRERGSDPDRASGAGMRRGSGPEDRGRSSRRSRSRSDSSSSSRGSSRRRRRRSRRGSGSGSGRSRSRRSRPSRSGGSRSESSRRHRRRRRVRHRSQSGNRPPRGAQQQQSQQSRLQQPLQMPQQSQLQPQLQHQAMPHHHMQPPMPMQPMPHWPPMGPMLPHGPVPPGDWWRGPRPCPPVGWAGPAC